MKAYLVTPSCIIYSQKQDDFKDSTNRKKQIEALTSAKIEEIEVRQTRLQESSGFNFGTFVSVNNEEIEGRLFFDLQEAKDTLKFLVTLLFKEFEMFEKAKSNIEKITL
jgi:hypothetical protein